MLKSSWLLGNYADPLAGTIRLFHASAIFRVARNAASAHFCMVQLRNLIIASGMTQIHVARSLGMNPSWFNRVCNGHGHLRASQVAELATVLRLPVADVAQALSKGPRNGTEAESERSDDRGSDAADN